MKWIESYKVFESIKKADALIKLWLKLEELVVVDLVRQNTLKMLNLY